MAINIRNVMLAAVAAIVCVLIMQAVYLVTLTFVRDHTDLAAARLHITQAYADGVLDGEGRPELLIHRYGHQFTECTGLHLSIDNEPDPLKAVLLPQLHSKYVGPCGELKRSAAGIETTDRTDYGRYWHGYRLYLWPMLETFSLQTVRAVNAALLFASLLFFFTSLRRAIGCTPAALFLIVLLSFTDIWRMWNITPHALITEIILAGAGLFAQSYLKARDLGRTIVLAALLGSVFNFYDFLINPPIMPMLLAFIVIAVEIANVPLTKPVMLRAVAAASLTTLSFFAAFMMATATPATIRSLLEDFWKAARYRRAPQAIAEV